LKFEVRLPAARDYIVQNALNEHFAAQAIDTAPALPQLGLIVQGGLYNNTIRALQQLGLADGFGASRLDVLCLNVVYPLVPEQISRFCEGKRAVLVLEEGQPEYIEQEIAALLRRNETSAGPSASTAARLHGKDLLSMAGEYHTELITAGLARFVRAAMPELELSGVDAQAASLEAIRQRAAELLGAPVPPRPPTFCV
ncbi:MAG: indolepyruvate ferredoxin oxidoreductase, partial [Quisquiliibacterium sp.]